MSNIVDRRVERTKRDLKEAFLDLSITNSTYEITIKEITNHANYNRATFYAHYQDKESLVNEIIEDALNGLIQAIQFSYPQISILNLQQLPLASVKIFEYIYKNRSTFSILLNQNKFPKFQEQFCHTIIKLLKYDSQYVTPAFKKLDREVWEYAEAYALYGMLDYWAKNEFKQTIEYMNIQLMERLKFRPETVKYSANIRDFKD